MLANLSGLIGFEGIGLGILDVDDCCAQLPFQL